MNQKTLKPVAALIPALFIPILVVGCGDSEVDAPPELSRSEVEEIVRGELAKVPAVEPGLSQVEVEQALEAALADQPAAEPGLTPGQVEEVAAAVVQEALARIPEPEPGITQGEVEAVVEAALTGLREQEPGLTRAEVEQIARNSVASIPPKSAPAQYTKFFVDNAISRYRAEGLDTTLSHYNRPESVDGQWYAFIIDESGKVISHYESHLIGEDLKGPIGTDANGYNFGPEMLSATEEGKWVSYVYKNPETVNISPEDLGDVDLKNASVVRHDGLLFGSGWYIDFDQLTQDIDAAVVEQFNSVGLEATVDYFANNPGDILGGVAASAVSYNQSGAAPGEWSIFIADENGTIVLHFNPEMIGKRLEDLLGTDMLETDEYGIWLTSESMRIWVVSSGGWVFGAGWLGDGPGN